MSFISILLICLCIGVEAFWAGFYLKCRQLHFSNATIVLAFLGSIIVCLPFMYFGKWISETSRLQLGDEIAGLIFGILGTLSLTQNIKRKNDVSLKWNLYYHIYDDNESCCIKRAAAFFTGMVSSFSAILACMAFGLSNITSLYACALISLTLVLSLSWGTRTSSKLVLAFIDSVLKYLPGCILIYIGILKFF